MANFVKLWKEAKAGDSTQHNQDPNGRGQRTITKQEIWKVQFDGFVADGIQVAANVDAIAAGCPSSARCTRPRLLRPAPPAHQRKPVRLARRRRPVDGAAADEQRLEPLEPQPRQNDGLAR
jgi:hypothetical protein